MSAVEATSTAVTKEPAAGPAVPFPSRAWFERLAVEMKAERVRHEHLGTIDCIAVFTVLDGGSGGNPCRLQVTFEEYDAVDVREVAEKDLAAADFVVETDLDTWRSMIESIAAGAGRPALEQTLNYLSLPGTPIRLWAEDPVGRDKFFRFNQSLQEFFNASAHFATAFPGAPAG